MYGDWDVLGTFLDYGSLVLTQACDYNDSRGHFLKMHIITRSLLVTLAFSLSSEPDVASQVVVAFNMTTTRSYGSELDAAVAREIHSQDYNTFVQSEVSICSKLGVESCKYILPLFADQA